MIRGKKCFGALTRLAVYAALFFAVVFGVWTILVDEPFFEGLGRLILIFIKNQ